MFNFVLAKLSEISSYIISFPYPIILYSMKKLEEEFRFTHTLRNCKKKNRKRKNWSLRMDFCISFFELPK